MLRAGSAHRHPSRHKQIVRLLPSRKMLKPTPATGLPEGSRTTPSRSPPGIEQELRLGIRAVLEVHPAGILGEAIGPDFQQPALGSERLGLDLAVAVGREVVDEVAPAGLHGRVGDRFTVGSFLHPDRHPHPGDEPQLDGLGRLAGFGKDHDLAVGLPGTRGQLPEIGPDAIPPGRQPVERERSLGIRPWSRRRGRLPM